MYYIRFVRKVTSSILFWNRHCTTVATCPNRSVSVEEESGFRTCGRSFVSDHPESTICTFAKLLLVSRANHNPASVGTTNRHQILYEIRRVCSVNFFYDRDGHWRQLFIEIGQVYRVAQDRNEVNDETRAGRSSTTTVDGNITCVK